MGLRLYDTAARETRVFVPVQPGRASIYLCGPTVQSPPHIGHLRSAVAFDLLYRWLEQSGHVVTFCRNVTDIDDKILQVAHREGVPWWAVAQRNERAFADAYTTLGCLPPTVEPRATGHVPEMIAVMRRLIDAGHAYPSDGDVYFDVRSFPAYGCLSGRRLDELVPSEKSSTAKRNPLDFALWKGAKPGEPAWETPWGAGRPGWHLECSAMAEKYLGPVFDIHGGGLDLVFPHHENELAQSVAAGHAFARYWLHHGLVTTTGEKMSKSLGNSLLADEILRRVRPVELRYYLATPHYRSNIEFSDAALHDAAAAYRRVEGFIRRATDLVGDVPEATVPVAFAAAMDDDLGVPEALAVVHTAVRDGNAALADDDKESLARLLAEVRAMLGVFGLDPLGEPWSADNDGGGDLRPVVDRLVSLALEQREAARKRRDFAVADTIRAELAAAGITVEDTPHGPRWTVD